MLSRLSRLIILVLLLVLAACSQPEDASIVVTPALPESPIVSPQSAGLVEVVFYAVGSENMQSQAIFHPKAGLEPALDSQGVPIESLLLEGIQLKYRSSSSIDFPNQTVEGDECNYSNGTRYIYATYDVRNAALNGTPYSVDHKNITFVAADSDVTENGINPVGRMLDFRKQEIELGDPLANCVKPSNPVYSNFNGEPTVLSDLASFQAFRPEEVANESQLADADAIFPYGYVVRNRNGGRTLAANPAATDYAGTITFAIRHPIQEEAIENPFQFSLFFEVFTDDVTRVTESIEEQGTFNAQARATELIDQGETDVEVMLLAGSTTTIRDPLITTDKLCEVKTSGDFFLVRTGVCDYPDGRIYVNNQLDPATAQENTGASWDDAFVYLNDALAVARNSDIKEIWVTADKTNPYTPGEAMDPANIVNFQGTTVAADNRDATFFITEGIKLYGGFAGTETSLEQRSKMPETILAGDLEKNDTYFYPEISIIISTSDNFVKGANSRNVLYLNGGAGQENITQATVIDGFIITGGVTTGNGAGLFCDAMGEGYGCSPRLNHLHFVGNDADSAGGGAAFQAFLGGVVSPVITNASFAGNTAGRGGGIWFDFRKGGSGNPVLSQLTLGENTAGVGGGIAFEAFGTTEVPPTIISRPVITNSIFWKNYSSSGENGASVYADAVELTATNILAEYLGNVGSNTGFSSANDGTIDLQGVILYEDPLIKRDELELYTYPLVLEPNSPAIDQGDEVLPGLTKDLAGNPRVQGTSVDLGAYEMP